MPSRFNKLAIDPTRIETMKPQEALGLAVLPDKINEVLVTKIVESAARRLQCG